MKSENASTKTTWLAVLLAPCLLAVALPVAGLIKWDNSTGTSQFLDRTRWHAGQLHSDNTRRRHQPYRDCVIEYRRGRNCGGGRLCRYLRRWRRDQRSARRNEASPQHAMDNNGYSEFMLFSFGSLVQLGAVEIGWYKSSDSDITVLAYTGCASGQTCSPNPIGDTYGGLVGNTTGTGWTLVGHYSNLWYRAAITRQDHQCVSASAHGCIAFLELLAHRCLQQQLRSSKSDAGRAQQVWE